MKPLNIPIEEFLRPFFDAGETVCLRVFDERKDTAFKGAKLESEAGKIGGLLPTLKKHNAQNRGVYFVINYGGHEDTDITRINAQFVECDTLSIFIPQFHNLKEQIPEGYSQARCVNGWFYLPVCLAVLLYLP